MKLSVYKYPLEVRSNVIKVPLGAQFLSVGSQDGVLCAWALVDPSERMVEIELTVVGTGWEMTGDFLETSNSFLGTVQEGGFVWHVFDTTLKRI